MRSGWFWNTAKWEEYQRAYFADRPRVEEYKSSPLANDHEIPGSADGWDIRWHHTQVLRIHQPLIEVYRGVRDRSLVYKANEKYVVYRNPWFARYKALHAQANEGQPRSDETYAIQERWIDEGFGLLVGMAPPAMDEVDYRAFAYWILYQGCAYYASGPSIERDVQAAVICNSLELLKARGVWCVDLGQIDGETAKEKSIGAFKQRFGGAAVPFTIARRKS